MTPLDVNDFPVNLAKPAVRALANAGISCLKDVSGYTVKELKQLHGIGPNAIKQLQHALEHKGLSFRDE
ncbi:hypothetical protein [Paenibacillus sp. DMB20]|uniref:hypothetical protein n=1 Tax=Paenibacillus sp. DMB20 TaxID=1642570 RepID=UPI000A6A3D2A|nr:hypothetical protein [Paenibacillus sp. DMB20]